MGLLVKLTAVAILFAGTNGQYFELFDQFTSMNFEPACGLANGEGNWTVSGKVVLASEYRSFFKHQVEFRSGEFSDVTICIADIDSCGVDPNPSDLDSCWCTERKNNDFYVTMRRKARVEESYKALVVALPLESGCNPPQLQKAAGIMPPVYSPGEMVHGTFIVEKSPEEVLMREQNVSVCPNHYIDLRFCVYNLIPDYHLYLKFDQGITRETTVTSMCLDLTQRFSFNDTDIYSAHISYDENAWCPRQGTFTVNFIERTEGCSKDGCIDEEKDTCEAGNGALARQTANIVHEGALYHVLCDTVSDGGNWLIIQRRVYGDQDFYKEWADYKEGFGDLTTDFWMGLQQIHELCFTSACELRVDLKYAGHDFFAQYATFKVAGSHEKYTLTVNGYSGNAGDALTPHSGKPFTTIDKDNDDNPSSNCAQDSKGGWWYHNCHNANLNGWWNKNDWASGVNWKDLTGYANSVTFSEMKVRVASGAAGNAGNGNSESIPRQE